MSFGCRRIYARGRLVADESLYLAFYDLVPGFDGLRVPARFAMLVAFSLAVLLALAVAALMRTWPSQRRVTATTVGVLVLIESFAVPIPHQPEHPP